MGTVQSVIVVLSALPLCIGALDAANIRRPAAIMFPCPVFYHTSRRIARLFSIFRHTFSLPPLRGVPRTRQEDVMDAYKIEIEPTLAQEARDVVNGLGTNLRTAVSVFLRRTVADKAFPFPVTEEDLIDEDLAFSYWEGMEQIKAGKFVRVTMEQLEAMAAEEPQTE